MVELHYNYSDLLAIDLVLGQRCTLDLYKKKGEIFKFRGPGSSPKPLSMIIKLDMCIAEGLAAL